MTSPFPFKGIKMLAAGQTNSLGAMTQQAPPVSLPTGSTPATNSNNTVMVSNWITIPDLTSSNFVWSNCNKFLGPVTTPQSTTPYIFTPKNATTQKVAKGYVITSLLGSSPNISTNDVTNFDYQVIITREPKCDTLGEYYYFLVLLPFAQPGSKQTYSLYSKNTVEGIIPNSFKGSAKSVFRLVLTSTNITGVTPTVISDSAIIRSTNAITPCGGTTKIQILSNSNVSAMISVPILPTRNIQYKALLNIRSSNQSTVFPTNNNNNNNSSTPVFTVNGDVIGYNILFTLVPDNASSVSVTTASNQSYPPSIQFSYTMFMSGSTIYPQMTAVNSASGNETADFLESLSKGVEYTRSTTDSNFIIAPNQMTLSDYDISFTTPIPLSNTPYNAAYNGNPPSSSNPDTRSIVLLITIPSNE
jgi:hypothetical protein